MGDHNVHSKKESKKPKQGQGQGMSPAFSSKPVFVMPQVIKKNKDEN